MRQFITALLVAVSALFAGRAEGGGKVVMCYFTTWAHYRSGDGSFLPKHIDPNLCTHILFAFGVVRPTDLSIQTSETSFVNQLTKLRQTNPNLKVLLALGGAEAGSAGFTEAASSEQQSQQLAQNVVIFLRALGFDGLDVDWEKPTADQKTNFTMMLAELRSAFDAEAENTNKTRLELTAALWSYKVVVEQIYEVDKIHQYLDYAVVMAYDFHGSWDATLGHNSPLYVPVYEKNGPALLSQNATMFWWEALGCPREKLVMGLAAYGRSFRMTSADLNLPGDAYDKGMVGDAGPYTGSAGTLAYYEVCELLNSGFTRVFDNVSKVPYAYGQRNGHYEWVSYDDTESMQVKANYIIDTGLGGAMFWTLDFDDFQSNFSGLGNYPLISTVSNILRPAAAVTTTTTAAASPTTTTTVSPTTTTFSQTTTAGIITDSPTTTSTANPTTTRDAGSIHSTTTDGDDTSGCPGYRQSIVVLVAAVLTSAIFHF